MSAIDQDNTPFWEALPRIFGFPFRGVAAGIVSGVMVLELLSFIPGFGRIFAFLAFLMPIKYGMETLRETANGNLEAPEFSVNFSDKVVGKFVVLVVACAVITLVLGLMVNPLIAAMFLGFIALVMPVIMMTLAIDEYLRGSLNPLHWGRVISVIGGPYFLAVALLGGAMVISGILSGIASVALGGFIAHMIGAFIRCSFLLITCHLLGWLVWQYREQLGFQATGPLRSMQALLARDDHLLNDVNTMAAAGNAAAAIVKLDEEMKDRAVRSDVHKRYRELLQAAGDTAALLDHGRRWLHQLLVEKDLRSAVALANQCFELDPEFRALTHEDLLDIAQQAERLGMAALRLACLRGLAMQGIGEDGWPDWLQTYADAHFARLGNAGLRERLTAVKAACRKPDQRDVVDALLQRIG